MIQVRNQDDHELVNSTHTHRSEAMKIMVADHDRDLVDLLSFWLKSQGYDVVRAFDGEQVIRRWHEAWPHLVLLDLHLPKCDGFAVCQQMRSETHTSALILTGSACEEDEVRVKMTPTESRLLHLLMTHPGQVLTPGVISRRMWGYGDGGNTGLIKTHIHHLRQKVEPDAKRPRHILTVPGRGYTFTVPVPGEP
jgi:DNA-binding response OmpR family regulator